MRKTSLVLIIAMGVCLPTPFDIEMASASPFTPLEWQQEVKKHGKESFIGQRKHLTWNRDEDHDFIDDEIKSRFKPHQRVNVIVDLNECLPSAKIRNLLSDFGTIKYIGKLVTFVLLDDVPVKILPQIAALPIVAMVEWHVPIRPMNRISTRAIQARKSATYSIATAEDKGLTGAGVTIAIIDGGIDNTHQAFSGKLLPSLPGYDAPSDTVMDPVHGSGHGTHVAGTALGLDVSENPQPPQWCWPPDDGTLASDGTPADCGGVAPGAKLVDIKVCDYASNDYPCPYLPQGLDWLGRNAHNHNIRVANISLGEECVDDDGTSANAQLVNHLVMLGIAISISHGNANPNYSYCQVGARLTSSPGSASFAMTVAGSQDPQNADQTVDRKDDISYVGGLSGPRKDFDPNRPNVLALKPDFSAPAANVVSAKAGTADKYQFRSGTSMAAPHVAGAAALLIEAQPSIDPSSLKDLLRRTADPSANANILNGGPSTTVDPVWNRLLGTGIVNVDQALSMVSQTDVGFLSCSGPPAFAGSPCQLASQPPWNNTDIATIDPSSRISVLPEKGVETLITVPVHNFGLAAATVLVNFGVYEFAVGNNQFFHIGTQEITIPPMTTIQAEQLWKPRQPNHQCIQISLQYGLDSNFDNNVTQRNIEVAPSFYEVRIENPFMVPARIEIRPKSNRDDWKCRISEDSFLLDPSDCPRKIRVSFDAPIGTVPGEKANCDIAVYATPKGSGKPMLIGGVTTQTFVPKPCRMIGQIVDSTNSPIPRARLVISKALQQHETHDPAMVEEQPLIAETYDDGIFSVRVPSSLKYSILVEKATIGKGQLEQRLECGIGKKYVLSGEGIRLFGN
jgi:hypothetical protein